MPGKFLYRVFVKRLLQLNDTPESIARGASLGMFVAMTPTIGLQMIIVCIVNTLARANRLAGVVMVYISNPLTMVPIYWLDYVVGAGVMGRELISRDQFAAIMPHNTHGLFDAFWQFLTGLFSLGWDVAVPTLLGGAVVGAILAIPTYPITLKLVRRERALIAGLKAKHGQRSDPPSDPSEQAEPEADLPAPQDAEQLPPESCRQQRPPVGGSDMVEMPAVAVFEV